MQLKDGQIYINKDATKQNKSQPAICHRLQLRHAHQNEQFLQEKAQLTFIDRTKKTHQASKGPAQAYRKE